MKPILVIPSDTLSAKELKDVQNEGYLVIVTDEPEKIKFMTPDEPNLMGLTKDKLLAGMMRIFYNTTGSDACSKREWLLRILLSEMGAIADPK